MTINYKIRKHRDMIRLELDAELELLYDDNPAEYDRVIELLCELRKRKAGDKHGTQVPNMPL